jgi:hypothetical protein
MLWPRRLSEMQKPVVAFWTGKASGPSSCQHIDLYMVDVLCGDDMNNKIFQSQPTPSPSFSLVLPVPSSIRIRSIQNPTVLVIAFLLISGAAQAESTSGPRYTISSSTGGAIGLATAANFQVRHNHQWEDYQNVMVITTLNGAAKLAANTGRQLSTSDYLNLANQARDWLKQRKPDNQTFLNKDQAGRLRYATDVLMSVVGTLPQVGSVLAAALGGLEKLKIDRLESSLNPARQRAADQEFYDLAIRADQVVSQQVQDGADLAQNDPQYAAAYNTVVRPWLGCDATCTYNDVQSLYPNVVPALKSADDGSLNIDTQQLKTMADGQVTNTRSATEADISRLKTVSDYQLAQPFPPGPSTSPQPPGNAESPQERQARRQLELDAAQSTLGAISALIGISDPRLANQIRTVGGATIQVGESISKYLNTVETGGMLAASGLASAIMTGNVIQAAVQVFSLLNNDGPSPDSVILGEISKLSEQIKELHQDMSSRFDRVDSELNNILKTLTENFDAVDYKLGIIRGDIGRINANLLDIQAGLSRLEQYSFAWTSALSKEQLIQTMNGCLGYATRTGQDIGLQQYLNCENAFYTWAHDTSQDELWAGLQQPDYTNSNIYNILLNFPLSVDVNYVAQLPSHNLGLPALSGARLPNPNEWTLGARAYLQLAYEWPQYAKQINRSRIDDVIQLGTIYRQAVQSSNSITNGDTIKANQPLFTVVANKSHDAVSSLQSAIQTTVDNFAADPSNHLVDPSKSQTLNLWGPPTQSTSFIPSALAGPTIPGCGGDVNAYRVPPNLITLLPPVLINAAQLDLTKVSVCMSFSQMYAGYLYQTSYLALQTFNIQVNTGTGTVWNQVIYALGVTGYFGSAAACNLMIWEQGHCDDPDARPVVSTPFFTISQNPIGTPIPAPGPGAVCNDFKICTCAPLGSTTSLWSYTSPQWVDFMKQNSGLYICGLFMQQSPLVNLFVADSITTSSLTSQQSAALSEQITGRFRTYQQKLYGLIAADISNGGAVPAAHLLNGTKLLAQAYVNFGLPMSLQTHDDLRSLLYGDQSILDDSAVQADFRAFSASSIPDTTDNKISDENSTINTRLTALSTAITGALNQVQQSQMPESLSEVDLTLEDLQAFRALGENGALPQCSYTLSSGSVAMNPSGDTANVGIVSTSACAWRAVTGASWLTVLSGQSGSGAGSVTLSASPNASGLDRATIAIIGGELFRVSQAVVSSTPTVRLETPAVGAVVSGSITVSGWALDDIGISSTPISSVRIQVDGTTVGTAAYGVSRPEICAGYPGRPGCPNVGFFFSLNTASLAPGAHTITAVGTDSDGVPDDGVASVQISVAPPGVPPPSSILPNVAIDSPTAGKTVSGILTISGWALDNIGSSGSPISYVQVLIDGHIVGNAAYGSSRPDICLLYPDRPGCPNVGFLYLLDTKQLSVGPHDLTITATDTDSTPDSGTSTVPFNVVAPPNVSIDGPADGSRVSGSLIVSGWALDNITSVGNSLASVDLEVDGNKVGTATYGISRPDICATYPARPGCPNVGFFYIMNTATLTPGSHTITAVATDSDAVPDSGSSSVTVNVQGTGPKISIESPTAGTVAFGTVTVTGWAIDDVTVGGTAVSYARVLVDGVKVGEATYGLNRPEVCVSYPGRIGCPNVGFAYVLSTTSLSAGAHLLTVSVADSDVAPDLTSASVTINVSVPSPSVYIDSPTAGAMLSGTVKVTGWALDNSVNVGTAITSVQVSVDSTKVGAAVMGASRPDICAVYPGRPGCPTVGFEYLLDTNKFAPGPHTLTASAADSDPTPEIGSWTVNFNVSGVPTGLSVSLAQGSENSVTLTTGQMIQETIMVSEQGTGVVKAQCISPSLACTLSPTTRQGPFNAQPFTVSITARPNLTAIIVERRPWLALFITTLPLGLLRRGRSRARVVMTLMSSLFLSVSLAACGSGVAKTPVGSYNVTVSFTDGAGNASQSFQVAVR